MKKERQETFPLTLSLWREIVEVPSSVEAWREELRSSGLIIMGLKYQAKRLYFNSVAKITFSYGNLHFHNAVQLLNSTPVGKYSYCAS